MSVNNKKSSITVYGLVAYDFKAERPDELEAKAGEAIIVVAQSNLEWIVAKPISRFGGPGLIPVSFVRLLAPVSASVTSHYLDHDNYWYIIKAKMEDGTHWELSRLYRDFYDLQIALLTQFEDEAGHKQKARTLPFMPGPVSEVTDVISEGRRKDLNDYIKKLVAMPPHIARCPLICKLFLPHPGDFKISPNTVEDAYQFSGESQQLSGQDLSRTDSRQSFHTRISASAAGHAAPNRVPSTRAPRQHQRSSVSQQNGFASQPRTVLQVPLVNRQTSSHRQTFDSPVNNAMEVKVFFQDDIIDVQVPSNVNFHQLQVKLRDQLKVTHGMMIQYHDEPINAFVNMLSDHDLDLALQRNSKLQLRVSVA
jgi:bud emergence protein 1